MTEDDWLTTTDLAALLKWDTIRQQKRKLRLYSCGCARLLEPWHVSPRQLKALDASERYADGLIKDAGIDKWNAETNKILREVQYKQPPENASRLTASWAVAYTCMAERYGAYQDITARILDPAAGSFGDHRTKLLARFLGLLRDIFGNPFRPVAFDPSWRTSTAVGVARQMYETRDFSGIPILADALQDAGCASDDVLNHCRTPSPHVRGCWVVDLVLGKT